MESKEIIIKDGNKELKLFINYEQWRFQQDWLAYREFCHFKYYNPYGISKPVTEEDSFENWKLRGKPSPKLFDRA